MAEWYKNREEAVKARSEGWVIAEPGGPSEGSELFPKCSEKAFMSFKFGCFGSNKKKLFGGERWDQGDDLGGYCCNASKRWWWSGWHSDSGHREERTGLRTTSKTLNCQGHIAASFYWGNSPTHTSNLLDPTTPYPEKVKVGRKDALPSAMTHLSHFQYHLESGFLPLSGCIPTSILK